MNLKDASFSLKINNSPGYDEINFNVVKECLGELYDPLKFIFKLSLEKRIFPNDLKTVTPVFKGGDRSKLGHYKPILMLLCFYKILDRIMYNRIYKYVLETKFFTLNNSVFNLAIQLTMQLFNLLITHFKLLKITCIQWVSLLNLQKLLYSRSYNTPLKARVKLYKRQQRQLQKEISFKWEKIY